MEIKKFFDKENDKIVIKETENEIIQSKPLAGYQSLTSNSSFKKSPSVTENGTEEPTQYTFNTITDASGKTLKFRKAVTEENEELTADISEHFILDIAPDKMSANIMVFKDNDRDYTPHELIDFLNQNHIVYGIDQNVLNQILSGECYYEDVTIAKGTPPIHGEDGYFEYTFNIHPETKPIILPDGSVDYNTLGKYELVYKDQLLATYHPAVEGKDGKNIFGEVLKATVPVELPPLKTSNADYDPSTFEYYSQIEGKATLKQNTLKITPVFIVEGNLEAATGDVDFRGDVIVKGNVFSNVTIKTTGSITINGHVEIAKLIAGKDILLKNGMQGSGIGQIRCGGNLMAKFLEQTSVKAGGTIQTNAILNCNTTAGKSIVVSGTRGVILGGSASAVEEIEAHSLGNRVGVATKIVIGLEKDFKTSMLEIDEKIAECKKQLTESSRNLTRLEMQMKNSNDTTSSREKMLYMREKIQYQGQINELMNKKTALADIRERSATGKLVIHGPVNSGSVIIINGMSETIHSPYKNVTITKTPKELRIKSNSIDDKKPRKK